MGACTCVVCVCGVCVVCVCVCVCVRAYVDVQNSIVDYPVHSAVGVE